MDRVIVTSSNVKSVGYSDEAQTLEVEFHSGAVYRYTPVEREDYDAIIDPANSAGKIVNGIKRDLRVQCLRVDDAAATFNETTEAAHVEA